MRLPEMLPVLIAEWERDARHVWRVTLGEFKGSRTIDVRLFYRDGDEWKPSRKGVTLSLKHLPSLSDALTSAREAASRMDLI